MAKVDGPLFSLGARGKIADAMVFFPWKGRHVVRQWIIPTNKQSTLQGYIRAALKAIGKWIGVIVDESVVMAGATDNVPAGLNWNAWLGGGFLGLLQSGGTLVTSSLQNLVDEYSSLAETLLTAFKTNATALALVDFALGYGYTDNIEAGLQLYFGAKACYEREIYTTAPYTIDPASWAVSDVDNFKTDHVA